MSKIILGWANCNKETGYLDLLGLLFFGGDGRGGVEGEGGGNLIPLGFHSQSNPRTFGWRDNRVWRWEVH